MTPESNTEENELAASLSGTWKTMAAALPFAEGLQTDLTTAARLLAERPGHARPPAIIFRDEKRSVKEVELGDGLIVGRGEGCDIRIHGFRELSRRHFSVRREGTVFLLKDEGSSNGTVLRRSTGCISEVELIDGDIVEAGGFTFLFLRF